MKFIVTSIPEVFIIEPSVFGDERGYFMEKFQQEKFNAAVGKEITFVQDNESLSQKDVLRGLHFQKAPYAQGKLVSVVQGAVLDVAVDIRPNSSTFGKHVAVELTQENKRSLWVPEGFAHGFLTLKNDTIFQYKCTNYYHPEAEVSIHWNDPDLAINWKCDAPILSSKDQKASFFNDLTV